MTQAKLAGYLVWIGIAAVALAPAGAAAGQEAEQPPVSYAKGLLLQTPDQRFALKLNGRVSSHVLFFEPDTRQNNTAKMDRVRLGVDAAFGPYLRARFENDFTSSNGLRDAYVAITPSGAFNVQFGQFKVPFSYEGLRSKRYIDFVERSAVVLSTVNPSRDIGLMAYGTLAQQVLEYQLAVMNGSGQNRSDDNSDKHVVGRLVVAPFASGGPESVRELSIGGAAMYGHQPTDIPSAAATPRNSIAGVTETSFTFFPAIARAGKQLRAGGHIAWLHGPVTASGEYIHTEEERPDVSGVGVPDLDTDGAYATATWMLTGERRPASDRIRPARPLLDVGGSGWGAWELALRYEFYKLRHGADSAGAAPVGNRYDAVVAGVNWYPNEFFRLSLNYVYGHFEHPGIGAPNPSRHSNNAVLALAQVEF